MKSPMKPSEITKLAAMGKIPLARPVYWNGNVKNCDICGGDFKSTMYDASTRHGWGNLCHYCFTIHGKGLGTGLGQKYQKQPDNRWLKVEG